MAYADYAYYTGTYKGSSIKEAAFATLAERASEYIDYVTFGRATDALETVKKACCAVAETMQINNESGRKERESVDDYSVSYADATDSAANKRLYDAACRYLLMTGLMHSGVSVR